ncbi:MAG: redoxin domain-containing protein [Candidatus Dojkabacteria bacterium]|nr:redoxin domain-containing protein [Candidatus Dojkabacteria bacterium]
MLKIGDTVPDLILEAFHNQKIKKVKLNRKTGRWLIILFYPADFTFVCPTELEDAAFLHPKFRKAGAEIMSVSTDTAFVHKAWHDNSPSIGRIKYPMLADPNGKMCKIFGTYDEEDGLSLRATFIIDPDGKVVGLEMHDNSIGRNMSETLRKLQAAVYVRKHKGALVCPANWKPGKKTLRPGADLVGKL